MKMIIAVVAATVLFSSFAAGTDAPAKRPNRGKIGFLIKPGSQKGRVLFVNTQTAVGEEVFGKVADNWSDFLGIRIERTKGASVDPATATAEAEKTGAELVLFIVDSEKLGTSILYAPETKWCILNVRPIFTDNPPAKLAEMRAMQETTRAFALLAGAMNSSYPGSLMAAVKNPSDLDFNDEPWRVPIDVIERLKPFLKLRGIEPAVRVHYARAVQEGWAPAPTNDAQKAVWDRIHAAPKNPMKIEFDPKKGR